MDNFGPLFVKSIFAKDCLTLFKVWVTLYTCGGTRGVILDIMHHINSTPLIKSFRQFVSRRGCPSVLISGNGRNFVSTETGQFVNGLGVDWSLAFERIARSTKTLIKKTLQTVKLTYEELQTVLYEIIVR